jgi:glucan phosphoethanolaminetransferase (alkaline phosphatase superfamily)
MTNKLTIDKIKRFFNNANIFGVIYVIAMIIPNIFLDITEPMGIWAKIANILVPLAIYSLIISKVKRTGVALFIMFIFIMMNSFQVVVLYLYGESIIAVDMLINCVTTSPSEATELLSNLHVPMLFVALVYVPLILWAAYLAWKKICSAETFRKKAFRFGMITFVVGIIFTIVAQLVGPRYAVSRNLYPFNVISNIVTALTRISESVNYRNTCIDYKYGARDAHPADDKEVYVLVIGETSRAIDWQLFGYERQTNPRLSQRHDIVAFPKAVSQSNTTHKCVPMMLTVTRPSDYDSIRYRKSIITAFKEAGYYTAVFSNQAKNHSYTQFFCEEADTVSYLGVHEHYDHRLVDLLKQQLADSVHNKQFIVLHAYGSHFNYKERYTNDYAYFLPDGASDANAKLRSQLVNAYDNTIRYTDAMLDDIYNAIAATHAKSVVLYTSDHGEDIFDDERERFLHASPVPTYYQLHVPLIAWASTEYVDSYPDHMQSMRSNVNKYVAPSQSIFFTLLDVAGIDTKYGDESESIASTKYRSPRPVYLNDLNESIPLEESGLKSADIKHLQLLGVLK